MSTNQTKQSGFSVVEGVVAVVVIGVLGLIGWIVYNTYGSKPTTTANSQTSRQLSNASNSTTASQPNFLDIKELGIRITLNDQISDVVYSTWPTTEAGSKGVGFSAKSLMAASSNCGPDNIPLGTIYATTTQPEQIPTGKPIAPDGKSIFEFGDTYYWYRPAQNIECTEAGTVSFNSLFNAKLQALEQAFTTVQPDSNILNIKEWGVRFKSVSGLSNIEYTLRNDGSNIDLTTQQLAAIESRCDPNQNSNFSGIGGVFRISIADDHPPNAPTTSPLFLTSINGYNYFYGGTQAICADSTTNPTAAKLFSTENPQLYTSLKTLEAAPSTYLDIKELGIKVLLNDSIEDAVYSLHQPQPTDGSKMMLISAQSLMDSETDGKGYCNPGALGFILETTTAPTYVNSSKPLPIDNKQLFKFGNTYYWYVWTQGAGGCDITKSGIPSDLFTAKLNGFIQAFQTVQPDK